MTTDKEIIIKRMVDLYVGIDDFKTAKKHFEEDRADIEFGIDEILGFMQEARKDEKQKTRQEDFGFLKEVNNIFLDEVGLSVFDSNGVFESTARHFKLTEAELRKELKTKTEGEKE